MDGAGKRVSWVELYLDLVFVLAVGQLAHLIVAEPEMGARRRGKRPRPLPRP
jgi:low temperature requirement protein LtrA